MAEKTRWYWRCDPCDSEYYDEDYEFCPRCGQRRRYPADETDDAIQYSRMLNMERGIKELALRLESLEEWRRRVKTS